MLTPESVKLSQANQTYLFKKFLIKTNGMYNNTSASAQSKDTFVPSLKINKKMLKKY